MARKLKFFTGEYYHLYNRGTEKRKIFLNKSDYRRFLVLLYLCNSLKNVDLGDLFRHKWTMEKIMKSEKGNELVYIYAYCLMPNHFHILVFEKQEGGLSRFMQKLQTAYTMYFNKKYKRNGVLFQGKFKAKHCNKENYLMYLFDYIHLNPIKLIDFIWKDRDVKKISNKEGEYLKKYYYSSYLDFCGLKRPENKIINTFNLPKDWNVKDNFKNFYKFRFKYKNDNFSESLKK